MKPLKLPLSTSRGIPVEILSDSDYSLKAVFVWASGWEKNGWLTSKKEPVKNADLVHECLALVRLLEGKFQIKHVAVHNETEGTNSQIDLRCKPH
ncbi:MAG: hypothetical protein CMN60_01575 [Sphingobium sp.]|nr:hypothetical protein [Sphingobium sp.]